MRTLYEKKARRVMRRGTAAVVRSLAKWPVDQLRGISRSFGGQPPADGDAVGVAKYMAREQTKYGPVDRALELVARGL
jgi:hypothetical protein